jgi:lysozyme family protein
MAIKLTSDLRREYETLFNNMKVRPERRAEVDQMVRRINELSAMRQFGKVENETGIPWFVVGIIHSLEASLRFDRHLHNGDPLTARTARVPKGRPKSGTPPFEWHDSAIDALMLKKLHKRTSWTVADIAFVLEQFNGFGYRNHHPHVKSPYLWSFSDAYSKGKYVADGKFSSEAASKQCGGMVLLHALAENDAKIAKRIAADAPTVGRSAPDAARRFPAIEGPEDTLVADEPAGTTPPPYPGRYLRNGVFDDPEVERVQERLVQLGIDPGGVDGDFGDNTENAVRLFQIRFSKLDGDPLDMDGVVGPDTWEAMFGEGSVLHATAGLAIAPAASSGFVAKLLDVAAGEVGVREVPLGSNRGPKVDQYVTAAGLNPAGKHPWCMCFVFWCFSQTATALSVPNRVPRTGGVHVAWRKSKQVAGARMVTSAEAGRNPTLVEPGMAFFIDSGGGRGHVGIVVENRNGTLVTIEGNTNDGGSREGIGVFRRQKRQIRHVTLGFCAYA